MACLVYVCFQFREPCAVSGLEAYVFSDVVLVGLVAKGDVAVTGV